jgi:hypothetical protein
MTEDPAGRIASNVKQTTLNSFRTICFDVKANRSRGTCAEYVLPDNGIHDLEVRGGSPAIETSAWTDRLAQIPGTCTFGLA